MAKKISGKRNVLNLERKREGVTDGKSGVDEGSYSGAIRGHPTTTQMTRSFTDFVILRRLMNLIVKFHRKILSGCLKF